MLFSQRHQSQEIHEIKGREKYGFHKKNTRSYNEISLNKISNPKVSC